MGLTLILAVGPVEAAPLRFFNSASFCWCSLSRAVGILAFTFPVFTIAFRSSVALSRTSFRANLASCHARAKGCDSHLLILSIGRMSELVHVLYPRRFWHCA